MLELLPTEEEVKEFIEEHYLNVTEAIDMLDKDNFMPSLQELYERGL